MNPMERFRANLKVVCTLKIEPEVWFSQASVNDTEYLVSYYQLDAQTMVLGVANNVATTQFVTSRGCSFRQVPVLLFWFSKSVFKNIRKMPEMFDVKTLLRTLSRVKMKNCYVFSIYFQTNGLKSHTIYGAHEVIQKTKNIGLVSLVEL
jgi:hypothetical protein